MSLSRRDFARLFSGAAVGLSLPRSLSGLALGQPVDGSILDWNGARKAATYFQFQRVADGVHVITGGGGNSILLHGSNEALLADSKNPGMGRTIRREAEAQGLPIEHFVNTHHHWDHCGGNDAFSGIHTIAHEAAARRIEGAAANSLSEAVNVAGRVLEQVRSAGGEPEVVADLEATIAQAESTPASAFNLAETHTGEMTVMVGGQVAELRWVSEGHTDGDTFIHLPAHNVVHAGDLLFNGRHPYVDVPGGSTPHGWLTSLAAMDALCDADTVVVPGHGVVGGRELIAQQRAYFERLMEIVGAAIREGRTRDEVTALAPADMTALASAQNHLPRNLGVVFDEMSR